MEADTEKAILTDLTPPPYHTVGQLQVMVKDKTGTATASRNRPALLKRLGLPDVPRPADLAKTGAPSSKAKPPTASRKLNGKRPGKPRPNKAPTPRVAAPKAKRAASPADLRAIALKAVTAAMARKSPPSLRVLCEELKERKIQRPRGGLDWLPSSVQSLMRQAAKK